MKGLMFILVILCSMVVLAQSPAPSVAPSASKVVSFVQGVDAKMPTSIPAWGLGVLAFVAEFVVRLIPTAQPRSLLLVISSVFKGVSSIFAKVSGLLDLVVQNIKDPGPKV